MRRSIAPRAFDPPHGLEQLRRLALTDRLAAKAGKHVLLEPDECASGVPHPQLGEMNGRVPLAPHCLEAVDRGLAPTCLLCATNFAGIDAILQQGSSPIPLLPYRPEPGAG